MYPARLSPRPLAVALMFSALAVAPVFGADDDMAMVNPGAVKWADAPPVLPKGAKVAVLHGDPGKSGAVTMRLSLPAGYKIAPHTHTQAEQLTVITGALYLGMGEKVDASKAHALRAGGFHYLPGKTPHFAYTKAATIVQVDGQGPFDLNYINPDDNPDKSAKK